MRSRTSAPPPLLPLLLPLLLLLLSQLPVPAVASDNDEMLALMRLHGATGSPPQLNSDGVQEILDFGKNSTLHTFVQLLERRLQDSQWANYSCPSAQKLLNSTLGKATVNETELLSLLPQIVFCMQNPVWYARPKSQVFKATEGQVWLYSGAAVLVMKVVALVGIAAFPCMSAKVYTMTLSFLVPLAISSLMGSTLFIFIPDALSLPLVPHYAENFGSPIPKMAAVAGGIYLFYLIEKLLRLVMERKERQYYKNSGTLSQGSYNLEVAHDSTATRAGRKISTTMAGDITSFPTEYALTKRDSRISLSDEQQKDLQKQFDAAVENKGVPPIAWIAVMGDCIRNFIDGTAIGAGFSLSPLIGISLTIAFIFEEVPTELGDVAILLNAGMSILRATMLHFAAAIFAFVGAAVGILLGDLGSSQLWIFAVSAGTFMYIALVDLMPEMNHVLDSDKSREIGRLKIFLLQNAGLIFGMVATGLLSFFSDSLHIDFGGGGHDH